MTNLVLLGNQKESPFDQRPEQEARCAMLANI